MSYTWQHTETLFPFPVLEKLWEVIKVNMQQKLFKNPQNYRKTCEKRYGNTASWETKTLYILYVIGKRFNFKVVHALENESNFS